MKGLLTAFTVLFLSAQSMAQVQFWNLIDLEDEQQVAARKENKISGLLIYQTNEAGRISDSTDMEEVVLFNKNGQIISRTRYKYDWNKKINTVLALDSFEYEGSGKLSAYMSYEGPFHRITYEAKSEFNRKGQLVRMSNYNFFTGSKQLEGYEVFQWDAKNRIIKQTGYRDNKKQYDRLFTYSNAGQLVKETFKDPGGTGITHVITRNSKGLMLKYEELSGKTSSKTIMYNYDANARRIKKETKTTTDYDDATEYRYNGDSKLLSFTYLQYPGYGGKNDRRHEYRVFVYR